MNERVSFVKAILDGNYDAAGVFADWLEESGDKKAGVLLRRRWKRWQKEHATAVRNDRITTDKAYRTLCKLFQSAVIAEAHVEIRTDKRKKADDSFRMYIRERFPQECYEASDPTNSQAYKDS